MKLQFAANVLRGKQTQTTLYHFKCIVLFPFHTARHDIKTKGK